MMRKITFYTILALLFVAPPMVLAWLLPVRLMTGIIGIVQLLTIYAVGSVIQKTESQKHEQEEETH